MVFDKYLLSSLGASCLPGRAGGEEAMAGHTTLAGIRSGDCCWHPVSAPLRQLALQPLPRLGASSSAFWATGRWLWLHSTFQASRKTTWQMQYLSFQTVQTEGGIMEGGEANSAVCHRTLWTREWGAPSPPFGWTSWDSAFPPVSEPGLSHQAFVSLHLICHSRAPMRPKSRV